MWLNNLRLPGTEAAMDILVEEDSIRGVRPAMNGEAEGLPFEGALVFPGLINSHDHLDFNLFPALANRIYTNYRDWGKDIHDNNKAAIGAVLKVPKELRVLWGVYKNLLNGFTTVVNHGDKLDVPAGFIQVFQDCHSLHSVGFERHWRWKLNRPLTDARPFVLHAGEGTDALAGEEIDRLIRWNLFNRPLIGVHGVAMNEKQAASFRALVWCPSSNYFLLDRTAPVSRLKGSVPVVFGTDSTLTADWNCWRQIRKAREEQAATDPELLAMLTTTPAATWRLHDRGELATGKKADLVIARRKPGLTGMDAFFGLDPEDLLLVLHNGRMLLFDVSIREMLMTAGMGDLDFDFTRCGQKYVVGDLPALMEAIRKYYPGVVFPDVLVRG